MNEPAPSTRDTLEAQVSSWAQRTYHWHLAFFIGFNVLLTAINLWTGKPWWALWPLVITGGAFLLHFLVYRTSLVTDEWVDDRASDIYGRSYDTGHINSIADRHNLETIAQRKEREAQARFEAEQRELIRQERAARQAKQAQEADKK